VKDELGSRVLVVGLGVTGSAVAETLLDIGLSVRVVDQDDNPKLRETADTLRAKGADVVLGPASYTDPVWADAIVPSPGVPLSNPLIAAAMKEGLRIVSEIELAWLLSEGSIEMVAVTGTNGKTTTTSLLAEMLERGHPRGGVAAGNIGYTLTEAVHSAKYQLIVAEVSSQQLRFVESFHPTLAIILNISDDHYDWHGGREDYVSSKGRITQNQTRDDLLLFHAYDPACLAIAGASAAGLAAFAVDPVLDVRNEAQLGTGRPLEWIGGLEAGWLITIGGDGETRPIVATEDIHLKGRHNLENVLAASTAALRMGVDLRVIAETIRGFEGLPHRMTFVAEKDGVTYLDDSKATNPHATLNALADLDGVVLIAGGQRRGLDLSSLAEAREKLRGVVVMGETASDLEAIFSGIPVHRVRDVEEAVIAAESMASRGDVVLLSPACASWDQYSSYKERGERFQEAVRLL
jgi:UDP-N-acetylmuramoylalanine--D-glutamate ligase